MQIIEMIYEQMLHKLCVNHKKRETERDREIQIERDRDSNRKCLIVGNREI